MALPSRNASNLPRWFRAAAAFLRKRRKKRCFLRETRQFCRDGSGRQLPFSANAKEQRSLRETRRIYRDGSGWQLPFSRNAERNDASFGKCGIFAAMIHAGRSPSPQVLKGYRSIRETRHFAAMVQGGRSLSPQVLKGYRSIRETRQFCFGQLSRRALLFRKCQRHAHQLRSATAPLSPAAAETKNSIFCFFAKGRHDFVDLRQRALTRSARSTKTPREKAIGSFARRICFFVRRLLWPPPACCDRRAWACTCPALCPRSRCTWRHRPERAARTLYRS